MPGASRPLDGNYAPVGYTLVTPGIGYVVPQSGGVSGTDSVTSQAYAPAMVQLASKNVAVAAGAGTTPVVLKASAGYLKTIVVTTTGSAAFTIYDNASAASGTVLFVSVTAPTAGTVINLDMPFTNGMTLLPASGSAAFTISYI